MTSPDTHPQAPAHDAERLALLHRERRRFGETQRLSPVTERGYAYDWLMFERWCVKARRKSLPADPETVALFVTEQLVSGKKVSTAERRWSAIVHAHKMAATPLRDCLEPRAILNGAQRIRMERPRQMAPLSVASLEKITAALARRGDALSARDRAVLVCGFASALRRSTLCSLSLRDVEFTREGLIVHVRKEKQDQQGRGRMIGLPPGRKEATCPVAALEAWLRYRGRTPGPLFTRLDRAGPGLQLHPGAIANIVKARVSAIGLDARLHAGHSLRSGFVTSAGEAGIGELLIAAQTGHRSMEVLRRYFRRTNLFKANAAGMIGL